MAPLRIRRRVALRRFAEGNLRCARRQPSTYLPVDHPVPALGLRSVKRDTRRSNLCPIAATAETPVWVPAGAAHPVRNGNSDRLRARCTRAHPATANPSAPRLWRRNPTGHSGKPCQSPRQVIQQNPSPRARSGRSFASLESESSEIPLRRSDLHTRFMVGRVRERVTQWTAQGPSAAGIPQTHGQLEKIDVIPGVLAVPAHDEDGDKIAFAKKALFRVLRALPLTDDADPWPSRESASTVIAQFEPVLPTPTVRWTDVTSDRATRFVSRHLLLIAATIETAAAIAHASSISAAGRSQPPNAFAKRARSCEKLQVPTTAPMPPAISPPNTPPPARLSAAPQNAPLTIRATNPLGAMRLGVFGSLSTTNSPIASRVRMNGVAGLPRNPKGVPLRCSHCKRAAQLTAAGAVNVRDPATTPIRNANR